MSRMPASQFFLKGGLSRVQYIYNIGDWSVNDFTWVKVFRIIPEFRNESQPQNAKLGRL